MLLLMIPVLTARAADSTDTTFTAAAAGADAEKPTTKVAADLGATWASGNTENLAVNAAGHASHTWDKNKLGLELLVNYGRSIVDANADTFLDQTERDAGFVDTAGHYSADLRYDRFLSEKDSVYALAGALADRFAGYDSRVHGQVGYGHWFVKNDSTELSGELGFDVADENYVVGVTPGDDIIYSVREMLGVKHKFNEEVGIEEKIEAYESVEDFSNTRVLNAIALTSNVSGKVAIKLSHTLAFDNVPVTGFQKLDQIAMASVVVTIL
jgi:putative salt-induced outer membrane protein YdiY